MLTADVLRKVRGIQIYARRLVNEIPKGQYSSAFKGSGIEFDEVREYLPGDDVRLIDWNVSARMGVPFVKSFVEERELTVILMVDVSRSQSFGSTRRTKSELAAELCAVLALLAVSNNDKIGLLAYSDGIDLFIRPDKGKKHVSRLIREVLCMSAQGKGTDTKGALDYLSKVMKRHCVVFIVSDFLDRGFEGALRIAARRHDLIALDVADPWEISLPPVGLVELEDAETGRRLLVDASSPAVKRRAEESSREHRAYLAQVFRSCDMDYMTIRSDEPYITPLRDLLKRRETRLRSRQSTR